MKLQNFWQISKKKNNEALSGDLLFIIKGSEKFGLEDMKSEERVYQGVREVIRWPGFIGCRSSMSIYYHLLLLLLVQLLFSQWLTEQSEPDQRTPVSSRIYLLHKVKIILSRNTNNIYLFYPLRWPWLKHYLILRGHIQSYQIEWI